jgi:hypothetical protein
MNFSGIHNLQVLRGLTSNRSLLSCTADGTKVDLWPNDDGSGRQEWNFVPVAGTEYYNIIVNGGVSTNRTYLSCTSDGTVVDLWSSDDGSGRQRWRVIPVDNSSTCSTYLIRVSEGVSSDRRDLSCTADGTKVDLWPNDDGSGRQRWQIQGVWKT